MNSFLAILLSLALAFCTANLPETCEQTDVLRLSDFTLAVNGERRELPGGAQFALGLSREEARAQLKLIDGEDVPANLAIDVAGQNVRFALGSENFYSIDSAVLTQLVNGGNEAAELFVTERIFRDALTLMNDIRMGVVDPIADVGGAEAFAALARMETSEGEIEIAGDTLEGTTIDLRVTLGALVELLTKYEAVGDAYRGVTDDILELAGGAQVGVDSFSQLSGMLPESSRELGADIALSLAEGGAFDACITFGGLKGAGFDAELLCSAEGMFELSLNTSAGFELLLTLDAEGVFDLSCTQSKDGKAYAVVAASGSFTPEAEDDLLMQLTGTLEMPELNVSYIAGENSSYSYVRQSVSAGFGYDITQDTESGLVTLSYSADVDITDTTENFDGEGDAVGEPEMQTTNYVESFTAEQRAEGDKTVTDVSFAIGTGDGSSIDAGFTLSCDKAAADDLFEGMTEYAIGGEDDTEALSLIAQDLDTLMKLAESFISGEEPFEEENEADIPVQASDALENDEVDVELSDSDFSDI